MTIELLNVVLITIILIGAVAVGYLVCQIIMLTKNHKNTQNSIETKAKESFVKPPHSESFKAFNQTENISPAAPCMSSYRPSDEMADRTVMLSFGTVNVQPYARLRFLTCAGEASERVEFLVKKETMLGRDKRADIFVADSSVSKYHVIISVAQDKVWITDQNTTNGTFLNGRKIVPMSRALVTAETLITVGNTSFSIEMLY